VPRIIARDAYIAVPVASLLSLDFAVLHCHAVCAVDAVPLCEPPHSRFSSCRLWDQCEDGPHHVRGGRVPSAIVWRILPLLETPQKAPASAERVSHGQEDSMLATPEPGPPRSTVGAAP
jgi:hypothetical protein